MFNSKHASNGVYVAAAQDSDEYQGMLSDLGETLDHHNNLGVVHIDEAGSPDDHMWSSNLEHWASGNYPSTKEYPRLPGPVNANLGDVITRQPKFFSDEADAPIPREHIHPDGCLLYTSPSPRD